MNSWRRALNAKSLAPILALGLVPMGANALTFNLIDVTPGGMSPAGLAGFQQAADIWSANIGDAITVNINIRFDDSLGAGILGSAGSATQGNTYSDVRTALTNDMASIADGTAVASLPLGSSLSFLTNDVTDSSVVTDNDGSGNNTVLNINTANAKVLGLRSANEASVDAAISFNSIFSWDFDQTDGVGVGLQDFVGVAVHEIGHALGFVSGVDDVDYTHGLGPDAPEDLAGFRVHSVLDLYRYSSAGQLNYATGGNPYFSIDGGTTNLGGFSTGSFNGDGRQASHWKDNQLTAVQLGIMDPSALAAGNANLLTPLDLLAFDVIGYELIPEPSSAAFAVFGSCLLFRRRRA